MEDDYLCIALRTVTIAKTMTIYFDFMIFTYFHCVSCY